MFPPAAFAKVFQLAHDDMLWWGEHQGFLFVSHGAFVPESPRIEFVPSGRIDVRFERGVQVDDIELTTGPTRDLCHDHLDRWEITFRCRKQFRQFPNSRLVEKHHHIHIPSEPRLAVKSGGNTAADDVSNPRTIQWSHEMQEKLSGKH